MTTVCSEDDDELDEDGKDTDKDEEDKDKDVAAFVGDKNFGKDTEDVFCFVREGAGSCEYGEAGNALKTRANLPRAKGLPATL